MNPENNIHSGGLDLLDPVRSADAIDKRREAEVEQRLARISEQYEENLKDPAVIAEAITELSDGCLLSLVKSGPVTAGEIVQWIIRVHAWNCAKHQVVE